VVALDESGSGVSLQRGTASSLAFVAKFSSTAGVWTCPVEDSTWTAVALTYTKSGDTSFDPKFRVNFADNDGPQTATPVGDPPNVNSGYCVGNIATQSAGWQGRIAHLQIFSRALSRSEQDASTIGGVRYPQP
jgi:hypothetical protein